MSNQAKFITLEQYVETVLEILKSNDDFLDLCKFEWFDGKGNPRDIVDRLMNPDIDGG